MTASHTNKSDTTKLPFKGLVCPKCDYDLTGTVEHRCPECGEEFDPTKLRKRKTYWRRKPSWFVTFTMVLLATYLPNTWIFWIDYSWSSYRWYWVKLFSIQPTFTPLILLLRLLGLRDHADPITSNIVLSLTTVALIGVSLWIGRRSRIALLIICFIVLAIEIYNAIVCHALFRA